ncbi:MAG: hypothetical protein OHK0028_06180 [Deltaproteobacteria bacterium]
MKRSLFLLLLLLPVLGEGSGHARPAFDQEKCSLCHIRESVFFDSSFLPPESLKAFDEGRLCGSCHNGAVQDSRAQLWRGAQHPSLSTGKTKERKCSACHSPHEKGGWGVLAGTGVSLRKGGNALCGGCHQNKAGGLHGNRFTAGGGCRECHAAHGGTGKALLHESGGALCRRCHGSIDSGKSGGHPLAVAEGKGESRALPSCLSCHPVHRAGGSSDDPTAGCTGCHPFRGLQAKGGTRSHAGERKCTTCHTFHSRSGEGGRAYRGKDLRIESLCGKCHATRWASGAKAGRAAGTHVTVTADGRREICTACHKVHDAEAGTPLLRSRKSYFCLDCHETQNTIREEGGIVLAHPVFEKVAKDRLAGVVRDKGIAVGASGEIVCATCHDVHGAEKETPLLSAGAARAESCFWCHPGMRGKNHAGAAPGTVLQCVECHPVHGRKAGDGDPWGNLCRRCHPGGTRHREGVGDRTVGRAQDLPKFDARGRRSVYGTITCPTCHDSHGTTDQPKRLRKPYRPNGFLCTSCHRDEEAVVLTPHDLRGIAGNAICEPCHLPHEGEPPWMWGWKRDPGETGEASCRACHREEGKKGLGTPIPPGGHPTNVIPARPLPDRFPLIAPGGGTSRSGVVSCPTCHAAHGTGFLPSGEGVGKLLRLPATPAATARGVNGSCPECHPGKESKHVAADCAGCHPPHREGKGDADCARCHPRYRGSLAGRHLDTGSGCGSCHRMHGAGVGAGKTEERCVACHPSTRAIRNTPHAEQGSNSCDACHPAHGDLPRISLKPKLGEEIFRPDLPCLRCHREGGPGPVPKWPVHPSRIREVPTTYGATVAIDTPVTMVGRFREGSRPMFPLFDPAGKPAISGVMGCLTCHDPHAGGTRNGEPAANAYLRDASFVFLSDMCASCHRGENADRVRNFHRMQRGAR